MYPYYSPRIVALATERFEAINKWPTREETAQKMGIEEAKLVYILRIHEKEFSHSCT